MVKINLKDRKILYQLDLNSRQSFSQIGKKVGLPKNVVHYRIKRLEETGIISRYFTVIDSFRLGYSSFRLYFTYQYTTSEIEKEIIDYFVKNEYTYWIASTEGRFNLVVITWVKDPADFYIFWKNTLKKYRDYFQEKIFSFYFQLLHYRNSYLLDDYEKSDREKYEIIGSGRKITIDELDFQILQTIASNARIPIIDIANELDSTVPTISYRLKKLVNLGIIQGFRVEMDISKLDYKQFKVDIDLKDYSKIDEVTKYITSNPHLYYITKSAGHSDLEPTYRVKSIYQLHEIMEDIGNTFPHVIKNYKYFYITKMHKLHYMPRT
jgi:DNA-binding Lrp family transcriptional regulator